MQGTNAAEPQFSIVNIWIIKDLKITPYTFLKMVAILTLLRLFVTYSCYGGDDVIC